MIELSLLKRNTVKTTLIGLISLGVTVTGLAQVHVVKSAGGKSSVDFSGFTAHGTHATEMRDALKADLIRSGWFNEVGAGHGDIRLIGSCKEKRDALDVTIQAVDTAQGKYYISKAYKNSVKEARRLAHVISDEIVEAVTGSKGVASTRVIMVGNRSGKKELYLCDADGHNAIQLTQDKSVSIVPRWGPKGQQITYTSYLKGFPDVYRITLSSGDRDRLAGYPGLNMGGAISPDGRKLAVVLSKDGNPELYIKDLSSGRLTRLTKTGYANESSPSWSPDGRRLVFVSDQAGRPQLYIMSVNGGNPSRLTVRGSENVSPDWGENGWIAYSSRMGGQYQIMAIQPDSKEVRQISTGYADWEDPSWGRDGRHVVCSRTQNGRAQVYILDTKGDAPIRLLDQSGDWFSPAWSPN